MTPAIEEILERLIAGGTHRSIGEASREALMAYGIRQLGADVVAEIEREIDGRESLNA